MFLHALIVALALVDQQPAPAPAQPAAKPQTPATAPAPRRTAAPATTTIEVRVTDRSGTPAAAAHVSATGSTVRDADTEANGQVAFKAMSPGTYRIRAEAEGFVTLEKELTVRAGVPTTTLMALSAAPPPPSPPPAPEPAPVAAPTPAPAAPLTGARGEPKVVSITDIAERSLSGRDNLKVVPVGCTNLTDARLIVLRDSIPAASYADADENLYLVAGEATVSIDAKPQAIAAGWFTMLPRGTSFEIARKGRNPAILLSLLNGRPCGEAPAGTRQQ